MRWRGAGALSLLAALGLGLAHTASFAPSFAWWLQILALAGLARLSWEATPRRAAALGAAFGLAWLSAGLWWLHISMHQFGQIPWLLAALAVLLLAAFLASYYAAGLALAAWLSRGTGWAWRGLIWSACWALAELARATFFGGFPWIASGYAHSSGPLAAWAPWIGVYGISALAAAAAFALAAASRRHWRPALALGLLLGLAALGLPQDFTRSTGEIQVSLLQPNVPQDQKFDRALIDANLDGLAQQIESARGQLVLTPESVAPVPLAYLDADYLQRLQEAAAQRPLLLGTFLGDDEKGYTNSLVSFGLSPRYDYGKRHLLPFGEFIPFGFRWFVKLMGIPMDDQQRGQHQQALAVAGQRLRPLICYEDLFGEDFVDSMVGPEAATVLLNVSNLAWFGTLMVQDQHLQFSQMRALEFQRPFVRSTNTGATAALNYRGEITARLPAAQRGVLEVTVEGRSGSTPYARWLQAWGLLPLWALFLAILGLAAWRRRASGRAS
ncbi:apolipoprotein N-acyltransferase [Paucibacter sp. KBW04]|uniref:apolipoprotein N-acyltransferase n=1 Tax=Paucibacter sp. KBW04 TaxID=2153361 RepID=UPI000F5754D0|nr:apolipoprotein N-acyltransferase [Paucibacter sp. KBW04]RQO61099.1 apolipoprotein N-acyltransferase [Paucibacter sp. KBW04]